MTYENAMKELQELVDALQKETISVDDLSEKVKRAATLIQLCKEKLRDTENTLEDLFPSKTD